MRSAPRYPVDRYLVERSKNLEMVNIIDDDLWEPEPALKPEDEIILRKLHEMLQSTAQDLKLLSGELSKYHHRERAVPVRTQATPLDEEFNDRIHVEELVNAKFNGLKVPGVNSKVKDVVDGLKSVLSKPNVNAGTQSNKLPSKKPVSKNLGITPTRLIQISEQVDNSTKNAMNNKINTKGVTAKRAVVYNEFSYEYAKPKTDKITCNNLQIQDLPSINIRSELKEQKVLQLDILPGNLEHTPDATSSQNNVAVIAAEHVNTPKAAKPQQLTTTQHNYELQRPHTTESYKSNRKVTKISTCSSSVSSNNISSETKPRMKPQKSVSMRLSPQLSARSKSKKNISYKREPEKKIHGSVEEWKRKLNSVYGQTFSSKHVKATKGQAKKGHHYRNDVPSSSANLPANILNNAEYIPYSKLTLGGARVSDVEREISELTNKDIPLSPILNKIISSQENSPRINEKGNDPKALTTSDENLLEEVLDLERAVSKTLAVNLKKEVKTSDKLVENKNKSSEDNDEESYADDFEDEKSDISDKKTQSTSESVKEDRKSNSDHNLNTKKEPKALNQTYTKVPSLAIKKSVDVFEFVHSVDTQDTATQSNAGHKVSLKETQTSPKDEHPNCNIQPIRNELWPPNPPIDPKGDIEKMFQIEKDLIKKIILDEYGDLIKKNLTKPSASQESKNLNESAPQKNTQTSPAHVKCVMTSPTRTKAKTTSPFVSLRVDKDTSPLVVVTNEEELTVEVDIGKDEDAISINLSSPRFNLRLPSTSREVLSNIDVSSRKASLGHKRNAISTKYKSPRKGIISSSSSAEGDYSSSELSSLGEIKLKKMLKKSRVLTISESSSSTTVSKYSSEGQSGGILPLKSEGEITNSLGQINKKNKISKSEGEMSLRTK